MKFVFCTEPIYQYYRNNLYDNTQDMLDRKSIIDGGYDDIKDQLSKLDENYLMKPLLKLYLINLKKSSLNSLI